MPHLLTLNLNGKSLHRECVGLEVFCEINFPVVDVTHTEFDTCVAVILILLQSYLK